MCAWPIWTDLSIPLVSFPGADCSSGSKRGQQCPVFHHDGCRRSHWPAQGARSVRWIRRLVLKLVWVVRTHMRHMDVTGVLQRAAGFAGIHQKEAIGSEDTDEDG